LISEGKVNIDGSVITKPSADISDGEHTVTVTDTDKYVGRGGLKLEWAIDCFSVDVNGKRCIDVGASTGGFTDCLLQNGAAHVCAVDSGSGQLHSKLLSDSRVSSYEGYNARNLDATTLGVFEVAVMDVSFISQTLIHPALSGVIKEGGIFISLIKPQFEAGRSAIGKNGIVKNSRDRENAVIRVIDSARVCGFELIGATKSPIKGGDGNTEYLACFIKQTIDKNAVMSKSVDIKALCK
jgi:23S rRNA (cytidine1920-2'-O)/16S rRNA (cytidine1409-2'-O)-methyltransferase